MMRLKDESFFLHIGQPVVLEFDRIKETANALDFDKGLVDFRRYGEFRVKWHYWSHKTIYESLAAFSHLSEPSPFVFLPLPHLSNNLLTALLYLLIQKHQIPPSHSHCQNLQYFP